MDQRVHIINDVETEAQMQAVAALATERGAGYVWITLRKWDGAHWVYDELPPYWEAEVARFR
jgi:hypothetical protein